MKRAQTTQGVYIHPSLCQLSFCLRNTVSGDDEEEENWGNRREATFNLGKIKGQTKDGYGWQDASGGDCEVIMVGRAAELLCGAITD